jgi:hypothetical protein
MKGVGSASGDSRIVNLLMSPLCFFVLVSRPQSSQSRCIVSLGLGISFSFDSYAEFAYLVNTFIHTQAHFACPLSLIVLCLFTWHRLFSSLVYHDSLTYHSLVLERTVKVCFIERALFLTIR